jgi:NitT/TauT family transport system substrate-binding protein
VESITTAIPRLESSALVWIAGDEHFFSRNGLNVTFHEPNTGLAAVDELLKGEVDIAGTAEFPVVGKVFQKERIRTIACIDKADYMFLVGRKDRATEKVRDLRGRRVGIIPRTIHAFYLGRFLNLNGMSMDDITLVGVKTSEESVDAILNGTIDAAVVAEPFASSVKNSLGANAVVWRVQSNQSLFGLVVSTEEWIKRHPELVTRFLKSLAQAEDYLLRNPAEAKAIMQKWLNVDVAFVQAAWSRNQFSLSLDQALIAAMEDEARWMITNNLTSEKKIPDFFDYIYLDGLKAVKPEAVNIIR